MNLNIERALVVEGLPQDTDLASWAQTALQAAGADAQAELSLRIVDEVESAVLNKQYRGKDYATNVLSFPCELRTPDAPAWLGDIVVCAPVVAREAAEQRKSLPDHWAHMLVHGCLHLLGHDHQQALEAEAMEALERKILGALGINDPY